VNTITRHVSSCGCNIEDSRLAMLGDEFTFIMLLSGSWNAITLIESTLPLKGAELDLLIVMKRTTARPPQPCQTPSGSRLRYRLTAHYRAFHCPV
jgi:glycine cleavage system transcriptional repressor